MFIECEIKQQNKYGKKLYGDNTNVSKNNNDATIAPLTEPDNLVKAGYKQCLTIMTGPPEEHEKDNDVVKHFLNSPGKKIVCGGTTANIVARTLNKEIKVILDDKKSNIPPKAEIEGIDLVTEGIITLSKTVNILDNTEVNKPQNPAEELALELQKADNIKFIVGKATNLAHQNLAIPIQSGLKLELIQEIKAKLENKGKEVAIEYF